MPKIITYHDQLDWSEAILSRIHFCLDHVLLEQDMASLAVSGGSTPYPVYQKLHALPISWDRIRLVEVDERHVPEGNSEHNWTRISEALGRDFLDNIGSVCRFEYQEARESQCQQVEQCLPERLDLTLLGLGEDGHFASLFPQGDYWYHSVERRALSTEAPSGYSTKERLSLAPEYIHSAGNIIIIIRGKNKEVILDRLMSGEGDISDIPGIFLLDHPNLEIHWLTT